MFKLVFNFVNTLSLSSNIKFRGLQDKTKLGFENTVHKNNILSTVCPVFNDYLFLTKIRLFVYSMLPKACFTHFGWALSPLVRYSASLQQKKLFINYLTDPLN